MKKVILTLLILVLLICLASPVLASGSSDIRVFADGEEIQFDQKPLKKDNRLFVPIRFSAEHLGAEVSWDASKQEICIEHKEKQRILKFWVNKKDYTINSENRTMDTAPILTPPPSRILVPVRFIGEALDADIRWRYYEGLNTEVLYIFTKGQSEYEKQILFEKVALQIASQPKDVEGEEKLFFPDKGLEAAIRKAISKPVGDLTKSNVGRITYLHTQYAENIFIENLEGIQHLKNLEKLIIPDSKLSDLSPLSGLTSLESLSIWGGGTISDLSPLEGLTELTELFLAKQNISNLEPLSRLKKLRELKLYSNQISNLEPLSGLTSLEVLYLNDNKIIDINPLRSLTNLTSLALSDNQIRDINPVKNLTKLESLYLKNNPILNDAPLEELRRNNPNVKISALTFIKKVMCEDVMNGRPVNEQTVFSSEIDRIICYISLSYRVDHDISVKLYYSDLIRQTVTLVSFVQFKPQEKIDVFWVAWDKAAYENTPGLWMCQVQVGDQVEFINFNIK